MKNHGKGALFLVSLALVLFLTSFASAEILLSQTESVYNVGDDFKIDITLTSQTFSSDFFSASLICPESESIELYKSPFTIKAGDQKEFSIETSLGNFLVSGRTGKCHIETNYANFQATSQEFEITSQIDVTLNIQGTAFNPKENVLIYGEAKKLNGDNLNGYVEITIPNTGTVLSAPVKEGKFSTNFTIPDKAKSGNYQISARAFESDDSGEELNFGVATTSLRVKQIMKKMGIAFDQQSVVPGSSITYTVLIYDQADEPMETDASIIVYTPGNVVAEKKLVKSHKSIEFKTDQNDTPGYWKIESEAGEFNAEKTFLIEEYEALSFNLVNEILTVENVGNVPYYKPFEVSIGGVKEVKNLKEPLPVGQTKQFKLVAPQGDYSIEVNDGSSTQSLGTTFLTGRAISVEDVGGSLSNNLWVLLALILILLIAIAGLYAYRYLSKNKKAGGAVPQKVAGAMMKPQHSQELNLIDKGLKQESEIIAINLRNPEVLQEGSPQAGALDSALWKASESGAKVYTEADFRVIVLTEILTKHKDNSLNAVSLAQTIDRILSEYNKRSPQPLQYGIGVHNGQLIVEQKDGKFRFISVDNSISNAKKISREANSEVLLSESLHRKTIGKVKAEKVKDKNYFTIKRVVDRSLHQDYIKNFKTKLNDSPKRLPKS